MDVVNSY